MAISQSQAMWQATERLEVEDPMSGTTVIVVPGDPIPLVEAQRLGLTPSPGAHAAAVPPHVLVRAEGQEVGRETGDTASAHGNEQPQFVTPPGSDLEPEVTDAKIRQVQGDNKKRSGPLGEVVTSPTQVRGDAGKANAVEAKISATEIDVENIRGSKVADIVDFIDSDVERAQSVLEAEEAQDEPRTGVVNAAVKVIDADEGGA